MMRATFSILALSFAIGTQAQAAGTNPDGSVTQRPAPLIATQRTTPVDNRLDQYGLRVLETVAVMAVEEATAGDGIKLSGSTLRTLRIALGRYLSAGERLGLDTKAIAEALAHQYQTDYRSAVPVALRDTAGMLDTEALIASALAHRRSIAAAAAEATFMNQIHREGQAARVKDAATSAELIAVMQPAPERGNLPGAVKQTAAPLPPEHKLVVDRVRVKGGQRVLTIQRGDTLGLIARAVYGDTLRYRDIFELNRRTLASPGRLTVGTALILPPA